MQQHTHTHTHINTLAFKRMRLLKLESYLKMGAVFCRGEFKKTVYIQKKQTRFKTQNTSIMMMLKSSKYLHTKETIRFDLVQPTHTHTHTLTQRETIFTFQMMRPKRDTCNVLIFRFVAIIYKEI